jgi:hypothetical protein
MSLLSVVTVELVKASRSVLVGAVPPQFVAVLQFVELAAGAVIQVFVAALALPTVPKLIAEAAIAARPRIRVALRVTG